MARGLATALAVTDDGARAVLGFQDGSVAVWDLAARVLLEAVPSHTERVYSCAISPDGRTVASAGSQHLVVRRIGRAEPDLSWRSRGSGTIHGVAFLDDHTLVSAGSRDGLLRFWWWEEEYLRRALERIPARGR